MVWRTITISCIEEFRCYFDFDIGVRKHGLLFWRAMTKVDRKWYNRVSLFTQIIHRSITHHFKTVLRCYARKVELNHSAAKQLQV